MLSVADIVKAVIEKEKGSVKIYEAAMDKVQDPGSRAMLEEILGDARIHLKMFEELRTTGVGEFCPLKVEDLKISEFIKFRNITEFSTVQDVLIFSIKRAQLAAVTYNTIARDVSDPKAKRLFEFLSLEKLKHKHRIEALYDDLIYTED